MELCIGTVQFGMDYGINGKKKPKFEDSVKCLEYAVENGIRAIDTAAAYGNAEYIVGGFLRKKTISREKLWISSKLLPNILDNYSPKSKCKEVIKSELIKTLKRLNTNYLDAYYFHSSRYAFDEEMLHALYELQSEGLTKKVGVSIYEAAEADACINSRYVSIIQVPYSVFDHRMKKAGLFDKAIEKDVEVNVRSVFLQGLVLKDGIEVPGYLHEAKDLTDIFGDLSMECGIDRAVLALAYAKRESAISKIVFGVHSLEQLQCDLTAFSAIVSEDILMEIERRFDEVPKQIVIPSLWKKD